MAQSSGLDKEAAEPKKPYRQILIEEISEGKHELERPPLGLFLSAISAGLEVGFSLFLMAVMRTLADNQLPEAITRILVANMYAVGFIFVVLGRSELFTEHTTLAMLPLFSGKAKWTAVARLWIIVYVGNQLGGAAFAFLAEVTGRSIHVIEPSVLGDIARRVWDHPGGAMFLSAVLAAWLMGLMSWLVTAARDTIGQLVIVWLIATCIGLGSLHHSVVGSVEVLAALFAGQNTTWANFGHFLLFTTLGNAVGGAVFVALLKYSHASRGESS
jgi:formate-nitrite transporter family protein